MEKLEHGVEEEVHKLLTNNYSDISSLLSGVTLNCFVEESSLMGGND